MKLLVDSRESNVIRHSAEWKNITYEVINNQTTADYAIADDKNNLLAVIERKSLEDFAASLKDGRSDNIGKLLKMRAATGCRIVYIIEGPQSPNPSDLFANTPYYYIESHIFHLMIRDGICVINTASTLDTAKKLARFVTSCGTLKEEFKGAAEPTSLEDLEKRPERPAAELRADLTAKHVKSDSDILREMWSAWKGISAVTADEFIPKWKIGDIVCGKIDRAEIFAFKTVRGRTISKKVANALCGVDRQLEVRLLSRVPGISSPTANDLVKDISLKQLLEMETATIADRKVGKLEKRLGVPKAENIKKYFYLTV